MKEDQIEASSESTYSAVAMEKADQSEVSAVELLTAQHREVEQLFAEIESLEKKAYRKRETLFKLLANKITMHAKLEEKLFYPDIKPDLAVQTLEAYEEHAVVKELVKRIMKTSVQDESWPAKLKFLKEVIQHHVEEEEDELFPAWEHAMTSEELESIGRDMQAMMEKKPAKKRKMAKASTSHPKKAKPRKKSANQQHYH